MIDASTGTPTYSPLGLVKNDSTTTSLTVDCPLGYALAHEEVAFEVYAWVRANGQSVTCTFFLEQPGSGEFDSAADTSPATAGRHMLNAVGLDPPASWQTVAPLHAVCTLPPKTGTSNNAAQIYGFETWGY